MVSIEQVLIVFYHSLFISIVTPLDVYQQLEKIIHDCFQDNLNPLIITEDFTYFYDQNQDQDSPITSIIINQNFKPGDKYLHHPKLATFVLVADSLPQLKQTILLLNSSTWWNIDSYFFLVQLKPCHDTSTILYSAWEYKLLSVILMCFDTSQDIIMLYTFNPFTHLAPEPWNLTTSDPKFSSTWNVYYQPYSGGGFIKCENLMYNKLKYLNGYQLTVYGIFKSGVSSKFIERHDLASLKEAIPINNAEFYLNLFSLWQATVYIHYELGDQQVKFNDHDLRLPFYPMIHYASLHTYPLKRIGLLILSQKQPFLSPDEKIIRFFSPGVWLMIGISFFSIIIVLMINKHQRISSTMLELVRLMVGHGIEQSLTNQSIRIFFFGVLSFCLILNGIFCSKLVEFLTKPDRKNIDSLSDLQNIKNIYIHPLLFDIVQTELSPFNKSICLTYEINKINMYLNHSRAVFIASGQRGYNEAWQFKLHISKPFYYYYVSTIVSNRFPFKQRINEFSFRWFESGLFGYWDDQTMFNLQNKLFNHETAATELKIRSISLDDVAFAFKLLGIGLGLSFVVFIFEVSRHNN